MNRVIGFGLFCAVMVVFPGAAALAQGSDDAVEMVVTPYSVDVAGKRVADMRRITRSDLAQHTVGGRVLDPLRRALREALSQRVGAPVRMKVAREVPVWFVGAVANAALWEGAVTKLVVTTGKDAGVTVQRPPQSCEPSAPSCASPGIVLSSAGMLVRAVAADRSGQVPCGGVKTPAWNLSVIKGKGAGTCSSVAKNPSSSDLGSLWEAARSVAPSCGVARLYAVDEATWGDTVGVLPPDTAIIFGATALTEGCEQAPTPAAVLPAAE